MRVSLSGSAIFILSKSCIRTVEAAYCTVTRLDGPSQVSLAALVCHYFSNSLVHQSNMEAHKLLKLSLLSIGSVAYALPQFGVGDVSAPGSAPNPDTSALLANFGNVFGSVEFPLPVTTPPPAPSLTDVTPAAPTVAVTPTLPTDSVPSPLNVSPVDSNTVDGATTALPLNAVSAVPVGSVPTDDATVPSSATPTDVVPPSPDDGTSGGDGGMVSPPLESSPVSSIGQPSVDNLTSVANPSNLNIPTLPTSLASLSAILAVFQQIFDVGSTLGASIMSTAVSSLESGITNGLASQAGSIQSSLAALQAATPSQTSAVTPDAGDTVISGPDSASPDIPDTSVSNNVPNGIGSKNKRDLFNRRQILGGVTSLTGAAGSVPNAGSTLGGASGAAGGASGAAGNAGSAAGAVGGAAGTVNGATGGAGGVPGTVGSAAGGAANVPGSVSGAAGTVSGATGGAGNAAGTAGGAAGTVSGATGGGVPDVGSTAGTASGAAGGAGNVPDSVSGAAGTANGATGGGAPDVGSTAGTATGATGGGAPDVGSTAGTVGGAAGGASGVGSTAGGAAGSPPVSSNPASGVTSGAGDVPGTASGATSGASGSTGNAPNVGSTTSTVGSTAGGSNPASGVASNGIDGVLSSITSTGAAALSGLISGLTQLVQTLPTPLNNLLGPLTKISPQTMVTALPVFANVLNTNDALGKGLTALMISQIAHNPDQLDALLGSVPSSSAASGANLGAAQAAAGGLGRRQALPVSTPDTPSLEGLPMYESMLNTIISGDGDLSGFIENLIGGDVTSSASASGLSALASSLNSDIPNMLLSSPALAQIPAITAVTGMLPLLNPKFADIKGLTDVNTLTAALSKVSPADISLVKSLGSVSPSGGLLMQMLSFLGGMTTLQSKAADLPSAAAYFITTTLNLGLPLPA